MTAALAEPAEATGTGSGYVAAPALDLLPGGAAGATLTLAARQAAARSRIAGSTLRLVAAEFAAVADPRDPAAIAAAARSMLRLIQSGQQATAHSTVAYLRSALAQIASRASPVTTPVVTLPESLRGLDDPAEPYYRPFAQWRYARSIGRTEAQAREAGHDRLVRQVDTDLSMAMRSAARDVLADSAEVIGYRRILRPEMSRSGPCGLCVVASDRLYRKAELLPIHTHCACDVLPATDAHDPGAELNAEDLARLYATAGANTAAALSKVRVRVSDHGELGPVLRPV